MANYTIDMIYLGNFADIDTDETNAVTENPGDLLGSYTGFTLVTATEVDGDNDGGIVDNEYAASVNDRVEYDLGSGPVSVQQDSANLYSARITLADSSTVTVNVNIRQMENGDVFMSSNTQLDNLDIRGIELIGVQNVTYMGTGVNQSVDGATVCFTAGTQIDTPQGWTAVETLRPGDMVSTCDNGPQPILWIGETRLTKPGRRAPIRIAPHTFGPAQPKRPLRVSPHHRIVLRDGSDDVLVAARHLLPIPGVSQGTRPGAVRYIHILTANHEVIFANGLQAETLFLGPQARAILGSTNMAEVEKARPERPMAPARPMIKGKAAAKVVSGYLTRLTRRRRPALAT